MEEIVTRLRDAGCVRAEDEAALLSGEFDGAELESAVRRREDGEHLEYILGWTEFCGLRIKLLPGVFIPRQRSTLTVGAAVTGLTPGRPILDVCCGSGALAAAVQMHVPESPAYATDIDPDAVECARLNLPPEHVFGGDLYEAIPSDVAPQLRGQCGVVIANLPHIPTEGMRLLSSMMQDEHQVSFDGGPDGFDLVRRLLAGAPEWLAPGGFVVFECAHVQSDAASELVAATGLRPQVIEDEFVTVVAGFKR